jgi:hypothetical protein
MKSREYSEEEIKEQFLEHIRMLVNYWDKDVSNKTQTERLSALAFSILSTIDGCSVSLPAFILSPLPHKDDKEYAIEHGENYYPQNHKLAVKGDIAGGLHESFYK